MLIGLTSDFTFLLGTFAAVQCMYLNVSVLEVESILHISIHLLIHLLRVVPSVVHRMVATLLLVKVRQNLRCDLVWKQSLSDVELR